MQEEGGGGGVHGGRRSRIFLMQTGGKGISDEAEKGDWKGPRKGTAVREDNAHPSRGSGRSRGGWGKSGARVRGGGGVAFRVEKAHLLTPAGGSGRRGWKEGYGIEGREVAHPSATDEAEKGEIGRV